LSPVRVFGFITPGMLLERFGAAGMPGVGGGVIGGAGVGRNEFPKRS
jgi:hypothetical protein